MKFLVATILCLSFASILALTEQEAKDRLKTAHEKCQADPATAVDEAAVEEFKKSKGQGTPPPNSGPHALCISKTLGWQNADGTVNKVHLKEKIEEAIHDTAKANEVLAECSVEKPNEIATAEHLFECFGKHAKHEHQH